MPDLSKVETGPVKLLLDGVEVGYTEQGIDFILRFHFVRTLFDEYGETPVELVHTGDTCEVRVKVAEWVLSNLQAVYAPGLLGTNYLDFGRKPGFQYSSIAKELTLHPMELPDTSKQDGMLLGKIGA